MNRGLAQFVRRRAGERCEYCRARQSQMSVVRFHVDHIRPRKHGGDTNESNLALACHHCNEHKGCNLTGIDPLTGAVTPLFDPRTQQWEEHFQQAGASMVGLTPTGRATIAVLDMNAPRRVQLRKEAADA